MIVRDPVAEKDLISVIKAVETLNLFGHEQFLGPRELAKKISTSKSSAHRILSTLRSLNYLDLSAENGKYKPGYLLLRLCSLLNQRYGYKQICEGILREHTKAIDETIYLFSYSNSQVVFEVEVETTKHLRYHVNLGIPYDIHVGAAGKAILANFEPAEMENLIKKLSKMHTIDLLQLRTNIAETRRRGFAFTAGERVSGVVGFASAILAPGRRIWGGVLLTIPEARFEKQKFLEYGNIVKMASEKIMSVMVFG
jgi:DNA-binding IclR family transcriptional regulator